MGSEFPLAQLFTVKGEEKLLCQFTCMVCCLYQLNNSLTMHIDTLRLVSLANSRLWLVLSNALDAPKNAETTRVSFFT